MDVEEEVVLSDTDKDYYNIVIDNMYQLPVEGYEKVSYKIGVRQEMVERCVRHYFYNESKNRSPEVMKIFEEYTPKEVKTFRDAAEKLTYCNIIEARAVKAMAAIKLTQKGKLLEDIAGPVLNVDVESAREYVKFFYAFREMVLKKETVKLEASGCIGSQPEQQKNSEGPSSQEAERKKEGEAIIICLDNSGWMESIDSPMFQDQLSALSFYCEQKFKHPDTTVGVVGMAGCTSTSLWIHPTRSLERIITSIKDGVITIGGYLDLVDVARSANFRLGDTDMQKRLVFFAGGDVCDPLVDAQVLGIKMMLLDEACDVISFGDPYKGKREFFDTLIRFADNNGNCNVCHVPPESSVLEAISRSHRFFIPRVGGQSSSLQYTKKEAVEAIARSRILIPRESSTLQYHDKKKAIDVYLKPPSDGADPNTDCPFCQTLLLTLKEKGVSYNTHFIDLLNKPKWFPKQNGLETLPLIKFHDGTWVSDSDVIVGMIDKKYQGRSLATAPHFAYLGLKILPKLAAFLKTKDEKDGNKQALLYELKELDKHLSEHGPYVDGKEITAVDLSLAPKLYHLEKACLFYKNWDVRQDLKDLPNVLSYTESLFDLESFQTTKPSVENVYAGWAPKVSA